MASASRRCWVRVELLELAENLDVARLDLPTRRHRRRGTAHEHHYERWQPLDGDGKPSVGGVTQIIAGTGGHNIQRPKTTDPRVVTAFGRDGDSGALRLRLRSTSAGFEYVDVAGTVRDSGSIDCGASGTADTSPPTAPTGLSATNSAGGIDLAWTAASDNVGVAGYDIVRNGTVVATTTATAYHDGAVSPSTTYSYTVTARDAVGNVSPPSNTVSVTTPQITRVFDDDFESGSMSKWTSNSGVTVTAAAGYNGTYGASELSTGSTSYAYKTFAGEPEVTYTMRFKIMSQGAASLYLGRIRTGAGGQLIGLYRGSTGKLGIRNAVSSSNTTSSTVVTTGEWHQVALRVRINGANSETEVWLDGARVDSLSLVQSLGTTPIGRVDLGDIVTGQSFESVFDDVTIDRPA